MAAMQEPAKAPRASENGSFPVIWVRDLRKEYRDIAAVAGISFSVARGSTVALLGGNGAGKTTTIAMLMGLVTPTAGEARVFGIDMAKDRYRALGRMNFQSPYADIPFRLTVRQNLNIFGLLYGVPRLGTRIKALADELRLESVLDRPYGALSAGQKTRVSLAKALLNTPELLLLDEPTASLDPDTAEWVRSRLEAYRRGRGATILLASHNMGEVERLASRVIMLDRGRIVADATPEALISRFGRSSLEEVFLDIARRQEALESPAPEEAATKPAK